MRDLRVGAGTRQYPTCAISNHPSETSAGTRTYPRDVQTSALVGVRGTVRGNRSPRGAVKMARARLSKPLFSYRFRANYSESFESGLLTLGTRGHMPGTRGLARTELA